MIVRNDGDWATRTREAWRHAKPWTIENWVISPNHGRLEIVERVPNRWASRALGNLCERISGNVGYAVLDGATYRDRCTAQACNCTTKRVHFGEKEPVICLKCKWVEAGKIMVSKGGALEPLPPEIKQSLKGSNPSHAFEALAIYSCRSIVITWEALRSIVAHEGVILSSKLMAWLCVGASVSRSKILCAVRPKNMGDEQIIVGLGGPLPCWIYSEISKTDIVRSGIGLAALWTQCVTNALGGAFVYGRSIVVIEMKMKPEIIK